MAHPKNDILNRLEGKTAKDCDSGCGYWAFPHLATACVLSSVFSVKKGDPCFIYKERLKPEK